MIILGIIAYQGHSSSAAIICDGKVIAASNEERFSRIKRDDSFPVKAIDFVLTEAGISLQEVDEVAFAWNPWRSFLFFITHSCWRIPFSLFSFVLKGRREHGGISRCQKFFKMLLVKRQFKKFFGHCPPLRYVPNHLAHSFGSISQAPFRESYSIVIDGAGEDASTSLYHVKEGEHHLLYKENFPHSLGILYASVTQFLGFRPDSDEYKVMGMSAYGTNRFASHMDKLVRYEGGHYRIDLKYFLIHKNADKFYSSQMEELFGKNLSEQDRFDIAHSLQKKLEDIVLSLLRDKAPLPLPLCTSGGVFLNCLLNQRIRESLSFPAFHFSPFADDNGTALGAAFARYYAQTKKKGESFNSLSLGASFHEEELLKALHKHPVRFYKSSSIHDELALKLSEGHVVARFEGRAEFGPRALGYRSILADPRKAQMKDIVNLKIKHREPFRPFAPIVLKKDLSEFFHVVGDESFPYMIETLKARELGRRLIPAVVHDDGTSRVQSVCEKSQHDLYLLLEAFKKLTGVPVLLNTSFNLNEEPIVNSPEDALRCFLKTDIDYLALGDYMVSKEMPKS